MKFTFACGGIEKIEVSSWEGPVIILHPLKFGWRWQPWPQPAAHRFEYIFFSISSELPRHKHYFDSNEVNCNLQDKQKKILNNLYDFDIFLQLVKVFLLTTWRPSTANFRLSLVKNNLFEYLGIYDGPFFSISGIKFMSYEINQCELFAKFPR